MGMKNRLTWFEDAGVGEKSVWNEEREIGNEESCC